jgi:transcriptional regulator with XRE-family HTH domain
VDEQQALEIGRRIAQARKEAGMTQVELAEILNISARSVQDYERGVTVPWKHFQRLEEVFKRPLRWFLRGESEQDTDAAEREAADRQFDRHTEILVRLDELREASHRLMLRLDELERERR